MLFLPEPAIEIAQRVKFLPMLLEPCPAWSRVPRRLLQEPHRQQQEPAGLVRHVRRFDHGIHLTTDDMDPHG